MTQGPRYGPDDVQIETKDTVFQGYFRIDAYELRHRLFAGGWSGLQRRELFERGHAAAGLLYDPDSDQVVLIEQFRIGAYAAGRPPWLIEVVAGIIEPGEAPADVVVRESLEEAGCEVLALEPMFEVLLSPGGTSESCAFFCCRVDSSKAGGVHGLDSEGEDIRVFTADPDEALHLVTESRVANASAVMSLQWLALNRSRLRDLWSAPPSPKTGT